MFFSKNNTHARSTLMIIPDLCAGCGKCMAKCRRDALRMHYRDDQANVWMAYPERCTGCGRCTKVCHMGALYLEKESRELSMSYK